MKIWKLTFVMLAAFSIASCGSDEPQWADSEAHEKTGQLREQYTPFIVGTWHYEKTIEKQRAYEQLTLNADGTLSGRRKWQTRQVVTIDGHDKGVGENRILLYARWDDNHNVTYAYSHIVLFDLASETNLQFAGYWHNSDGWTTYERGEAEPSF